jgi:probable HAF family extracellular repeat protein
MATTTTPQPPRRPATALVRPLALAALGTLAALAPAHAQGPDPQREPPRYTLFDLPSLGGGISEGRSIDARGMVTGFSDRADGARHAALWLDEEVHDLGTLGGPHSAVVFRGNNNRALVVGIAQREDLDPRQEAWSCSAFFPGGLDDPTGHVCRGFAWWQGGMKEMPTLGGTHSFAAGANNRGVVVGWAENEVEDLDCVLPQRLQFRPVLWDPRTDELRELPPFPGDEVGTANAVNDRGQVVGISGICGEAVGGVSAIHAVLWEDGEAIDLGNLGAEVWNTPVAINEAAEVVGFAGLPSGFLGAFYWSEETGIEPLGTLREEHVHSEAWGIDNRGRAVGISCDAAFLDCRAFLWQEGEMFDLNDLTPAGAPHLRTARDISDRGMITGQAIDAATGARRAYLAIPTPGRRGPGGE